MQERRTHTQRAMRALVVVAFTAISLLSLLTSGKPWVAGDTRPTAAQVAMVGELVETARQAREDDRATVLDLNGEQIGAMAAMASQGLAPNRFDAQVQDGQLTLVMSRPFLFRWINIQAQATGTSEKLPAFALEIGSLPLPDWLSRTIQNAVQHSIDKRIASLPDIDQLVHETSIEDDSVTARIVVPDGSLVAHIGASRGPIDGDLVAATYCKLGARQETDPAQSLAIQLRRALAASEPNARGHTAALVALAMYANGADASQLIVGREDIVRRCDLEPATITLHGRADWAKHWTLSAALAATSGERMSSTLGEWKELADSAEKRAELAPGDPSGFSFVDLASDRAGISYARQLLDPADMEVARERLMKARERDILPLAAIELDDRLSDAAFRKQYGSTGDPRYKAMVDKIDRILVEGRTD